MGTTPQPRQQCGRRHLAGGRVLSVCAAAAVLTACSGPPGNAAAPTDTSALSGASASSGSAAQPDKPEPATFTSKRWHFTIAKPTGWAIHHGFGKSYLQSGTWKTYAGPDSRGTPVLALTVPGSNHITDAKLRIGVSEVPAEVAACTTPPDSVRSGSVGNVDINGIPFTRFEAADAAMSHYLDVRSYRVVHDHACYAIDLLVYGTNPEVYDPPATPPFSRQQAFTRLQQALQGFRFTR